MKNRDILSKLRTFIVCALLSTITFTVYAQAHGADRFQVGHYNVTYIDRYNKKITTIDSIDLYELYNLERDTIINVLPTKFERGVQITTNTGVSGLLKESDFTHYDISGNLKQQLADAMYLNTGVSLGISTGEYGSLKTPHYRKDQMIEIGIPVSLEITNLYQDYKKTSLYGGIGFTPAFYKTTKIDTTSADKVRNSNQKDFGILVSPRADFGAYIPLFGQVFRVGIYGEYRICCFQNISIYKKRVSKSMLGLNVGLVF